MRYELAFASSGPARPDRAAFERYFASRPRWSVRRGHAAYADADTGVGLTFDYLEGAPGRADAAWARFGLELPRASFFAEEATLELGAFAAQFGGTLAGAAGFQGSTYNVADFLRTWEAANRDACLPFLAHARPGEPPFALPRAQLLRSWQWNFQRAALQASEGEVFVPRVWYVRMPDGGVGTCVIWPDAMPVRVPQADYVIFSRDQIAPKTRLGRRRDVAVAPWSLIASSVTGQAFYDRQVANWRVTDPRALTGITRLVSKLRGTTDMPDFVPEDAIIDRECLAG